MDPSPARPPGKTHPFGPHNLPYDALGGDHAVRALVDAFYDRMASPYPRLHALHPEDDRVSRDKLYEFLSGWLGGPQLYMEKRGHPRLRMRHAPFPIDRQQVDDWLACMRDAMDERGISGELRDFLEDRFAHTAEFMRNR